MGLELVVKLIADASGVVAGTDAGSKGFQAFGKSVDLGGIAKVAAFAGVAGVAAGAIIEMTTAASDDAAEQERLMAAVEAAGAAHGDYATQIDAAIAAGQELAFTDTEIRDALVPLIGVTGDVSKANADLALAQDLARLKGISLEQAATAIAKAQGGQTTALKKLIPTIEKGASVSDAMAEAQRVAAGQAKKFGESTKGQMESSAIAFSELGETIGSAFMPALTAILPALKPMMAALGQLITAVLPLLIPLLSIVGKVLGVVASAIAKLVGWLAQLIRWLSEAARKIGDFLGKLGPLKSAANFIGSIHLPFTAAASAGGFGAQGRGAPATASAGWAPAANVTVVAYGDPALIEASVIRALRHYDRRNGPNQVLPRWS